MSGNARLNLCVLYEHELHRTRQQLDAALAAINEAKGLTDPEEKRKASEAAGVAAYTALYVCHYALEHVAEGSPIVVVSVPAVPGPAGNEENEESE